MGGLDDLTNQAGQAGGMQEKISDTGIDKVGDVVDEKTGGGHAEQIDKAQQIADQKIGE